MKLAIPKLSCGVTRRGAPMGRPNHVPHDYASARLSLRRLALVDGDYDSGGAYWGRSYSHGDIYWAAGYSDTEAVEIFVRARSRDEAKRLILATYEGARFYR